MESDGRSRVGGRSAGEQELQEVFGRRHHRPVRIPGVRSSRSGFGTLAMGSAVAVLFALSVAPEPIHVQDIAPNPPGEGVVVTPSGLVLPVT